MGAPFKLVFIKFFSQKFEIKHPNKSTLNNKGSDLIGSLVFEPNQNLKIDYNFSMDNDFESRSSPTPDLGFDLDMLLKPDARVIQFPFVTESSIVPSAAFIE